ncbi:GDSL esterase/lipase At1g28590-like [Coffea eugenioides]|uniref:GDSL esterase/lipase At1g28590-like n=1 Tax=Coffea eugenioides TaxID=49369 RepID=UPI000F614C94|nr:GDSL esterase/lipase At1g28590-like [Coffea eugenioides]
MAASSSIQLLTPALAILILSLLKLSTSPRASAGSCYKSIISFGDSLTDTGNLVQLFPPDNTTHCHRPPYGETFFNHPTGRCSNGRLIIDFFAESFGLPLVPPYLWRDDSADFRQGVNFAVSGATALNNSFFLEMGLHDLATNVSLGTQLRWFKDILPSLCSSNSSDCGSEFLQSSFVLMGEIGGDDYNHALLNGIKLDEVKSYVPAVVREIASAIEEMIKLGAVTLVVPGNLPIGCLAAYLTDFQSSNQHDYDTATGCINWLNDLAKYHNRLLQKELNRIRTLHPHATIIYADYYNAAMRLYRSPITYGFRGEALRACCGAGGPYNYISSIHCGDLPTTPCDDPSLYVNWDGLHLTEAAYQLVAQGMLQGPYSNPPINTICPLASTSSGLLL